MVNLFVLEIPRLFIQFCHHFPCTLKMFVKANVKFTFVPLREANNIKRENGTAKSRFQREWCTPKRVNIFTTY